MAALLDALHSACASVPEQMAVVDGHRSLSYPDLDGLSSTAAAQLVAAGIRPGDRVALHLTNGWEIVVAYYACFKCGAIALPINTRFKAAEIDYVLRHAVTAAYIGRPELAREISEWPPDLRVRFVTGTGLDGARSFEELLQPAPVSFAITPSRDDRPAAVLYTSGTTARPKGVTHTQGTLSCMARLAVREFFVPGDIAMIPLPLVHMAALLGLVAGVEARQTMVVLPFDPNALLDMFERHRATAMIGMPVLYRMLVEAQAQKPRDISSARAFFVGGDSVPTALQDQFTALFGRPLCEAYGLSEIVPISVNPPGAMRTGSLGRPVADITVRIVDDEFRDVQDGAVGEVAVKSRATTIGYWNDPAATAHALRDGWFLTGDLAYRDPDGFLWFAGRKKEIIVRGGSNVSPQEVEEAVYQHPAVREVAVVGAPNERWGEIVVACVVRHEGRLLSEPELIAFVRERISLYKAPERVVFADALPKGPTGKILRRAVRESLVYR